MSRKRKLIPLIAAPSMLLAGAAMFAAPALAAETSVTPPAACSAAAEQPNALCHGVILKKLRNGTDKDLTFVSGYSQKQKVVKVAAGETIDLRLVDYNAGGTDLRLYIEQDGKRLPYNLGIKKGAGDPMIVNWCEGSTERSNPLRLNENQSGALGYEGNYVYVKRIADDKQESWMYDYASAELNVTAVR